MTEADEQFGSPMVEKLLVLVAGSEISGGVTAASLGRLIRKLIRKPIMVNLPKQGIPSSPHQSSAKLLAGRAWGF